MIHVTLCTGLRRSGSTWSYNVARLLMESVARARSERCYANYHDGETLDDALRWAAKNGSGFYVVKSHLPGPFAMKAIATGKAWNIVTFRDPRDVVVSLRDFKQWSVEDCVRAVLHEMPYIEAFWPLPTSLKLRYEDMKQDPMEQIRTIARFLRVRIEASFVEQLYAQTSSEAHRKVSESLPRLGEDAVRREEDHLVHRKQLLHTGHIADGETGKWQQRLSGTERAWVVDQLAPAARLMGYQV